jgi:serine protease Do
MNFTALVTGLGLLTLASLPITASIAAPTHPGAMQKDLTSILKSAMPAVVNIACQVEVKTPVNPFAQGQHRQALMPPAAKRFESFGSGVVVDATNGYILTNAHVIHDAKTITVTLSDGRVYHAKLIGEDVGSDLAVLKITADNLTAMQLGNSDDLQVGQAVAAIGNPFGFNQTVTSGIVSALQRSELHLESLEDFIQTDAPINPGNSGGALVDMTGKLIGINTAIYGPDGGSVGIGFAIPVNMARSVMEQLIQYGAVRRGILGIIVQTLTPDLAIAFKQLMPEASNARQANSLQGAVVDSIVPDSPAAKAGIKIGDIIHALNGKTIKTGPEIRNTVGLLQIGAKLNIEVIRQGKPLTLQTIVIDPKEQEQIQEHNKRLLSGLTLQDISAQVPNHGYTQGVLVVDIDEDSTAWHRGLRTGDVIVSANFKEVHSISELNKIAEQSPNQLLLNIQQGPFAQFLVLK